MKKADQQSLHPLIDFILNFGIGETTAEEDIRFIKTLNVSIAFFFVYSIGCIFFGISSGDYILAVLQIPCLFGLLLAVYLNKRGFHSSSVTIILLILITAFSALQFFYGGNAQLHIWLLVPIMGTCLGYPPKHSRFAFFIGGLAILALTGIEYMDIPTKVVSPMLDDPQGRANNLFALGAAILAVAFVSRSLLIRAESELRAERELTDKLLYNTLPKAIAERLKKEEGTIADDIDSCSVLFCDVVGFTELSEKLSATELVKILNELFTMFDELCGEYGVEKIKTIGDAYMVVAGLPEPVENHALDLTHFAQAMLKLANNFETQLHHPLKVRIGIDSGPVVAGIIGKSKFSYDIWGDTVNTAARMESHGVEGRIQLTDATKQLLGDAIATESRGSIEIKGKGQMKTYLVRA